MTQIIAVANEKGGVAKTTTSLSLGGAYVDLGREVLLVDLDPQGNLSLALGMSPHKVRRSVADILLNSSTPLGISRETSIPGLDLIPANADVALAERFLPVRQDYKTILMRSLSMLQRYDIIILDCPPSLGVLTQNALTAADLLVIPTQAEYFSIYGIRSMLNTLRSIRGNENPQLGYRILVTMLDVRIGSHKMLLTQLRSSFGAAVLKTVIQIDSKLRESVIAGLPITHFSPKSRSSQQYCALAQELLKYVKTEKISQPA